MSSALRINRPRDEDLYLKSVNINGYLSDHVYKRLTSENKCSLGAALITQQREEDGCSVLKSIIDEVHQLQHYEPPEWFGDALYNHGIGLCKLRREDEGCDYFRSAQDEFERTHNREGYVLAAVNLISTSHKLQKPPRETNDMVTHLLELIGSVALDPAFRFRIYLLSAVVAFAAEKIEDAIVFTSEALKLCLDNPGSLSPTVNIPVASAVLTQNIGRIHW